jgi:hypothetical protein
VKEQYFKELTERSVTQVGKEHGAFFSTQKEKTDK